MTSISLGARRRRGVVSDLVIAVAIFLVRWEILNYAPNSDLSLFLRSQGVIHWLK